MDEVLEVFEKYGLSSKRFKTGAGLRRDIREIISDGEFLKHNENQKQIEDSIIRTLFVHMGEEIEIKDIKKFKARFPFLEKQDSFFKDTTVFCSNDKGEIQMTLDLERVAKKLLRDNSKESREGFIQNHPDIQLKIVFHPNESDRIIIDKAIDLLNMITDEVNASDELSAMKKEILAHLRKNIDIEIMREKEKMKVHRARIKEQLRKEVE